ncbi:MAG TPA: ATP-binding protein [Candidatus Saccharimonadia bacterium]|nr:ATP-binding protein [Candidatus Saccharimonadia bacterium]
MKISQKLLLLFLLIALIPIIVIGTFSYVNTQRKLNAQIKTQISNTLTRQSNKIDDLVTADLRSVDIFVVRAEVRFLTNQYNQQPTVAHQQTLSDTLTNIRNDDRSFRRIHILNTKGIVIGSSDTRFIGKDYSKTAVFQKGLQGVDVSMFFNDIDGVLGHYLTERLILDNQVIGVAIMESEADTYSLITSDYTDTGQTGETFIVGHGDTGKPEYLTPLRFKTDAALTPYTSSQTQPPRDYRNHPVVLVTRDISTTHWKVGVKIDEAEVYAPIYQLRNVTIGIIIITTLIIIFFGWYFARLIVTPIRRFTEVVTQIRRGDLSRRVQVGTNDEIGILGSAFNEMTSNLLESRARLIASVLSLSQGFIMTNQQGAVTTINDAARKLLGVGPSAPEDTPPSLTTLFVPEKLGGVDIQKSVSTCFREQTPSELKDVTFEKSFYNFYFSPVVINGQAIGVVILISDETQERQLQRSRDEFFSIASHELRTPLTAIMGNASLIKSFYVQKLKDDTEFEKMVTDINYSAKRLIGIVNDFLDVTSLELGKIVFTNKPVDLVQLAHDVIKKSFTAPDVVHGITITVQPPAKPLRLAFGDVDRIKQVLSNLVNNTLTFTADGGKVIISFKATESFIEVSVADTGCGMSEDNQKLLFHKFQQASDSILTRNTAKGTGLGLYISKLIMEGIGGRIWLAQTVVDKGTTFTFSVPLATDEQVKTAKAAHEAEIAALTALSASVPSVATPQDA